MIRWPLESVGENQVDPFTGNMGSLNFFHSLNLLELALRLCGLGVLGSKPVNKTHQPFYLLCRFS